jgi:hypothetical protein
MWPEVERSARAAFGGGLGVVAFVVVLVALGKLLSSLLEPAQTLSIRVSGDEDRPYKITYENSGASYTEKSRVPDEHTISITMGPNSDDYVRATAKNLGPSRRLVPGDELANVDLELVAEDGMVLDEDCLKCSPQNYASNQVDVEYKGEDL